MAPTSCPHPSNSPGRICDARALGPPCSKGRFDRVLMTRILNVVRFASLLGMREFFVMYPVKVYLLSWLPRIGGQLAFFGFALHYAGHEQATRYALIGNGLFLATLTTLSFVAVSYMLERGIGSMPLLLASPTNPFLILCSRNAGMAWHGITTGLISLFAAF